VSEEMASSKMGAELGMLDESTPLPEIIPHFGRMGYPHFLVDFGTYTTYENV
jgi:hypothetical protein